LAERVSEDGHDADGGHAACPYPGRPAHPHAGMGSRALRFEEPERGGGQKKAERGERIHGDTAGQDTLECVDVELPSYEGETTDQQDHSKERPRERAEGLDPVQVKVLFRDSARSSALVAHGLAMPPFRRRSQARTRART